ncbi:hypothetical protein DVH05_016879 [Phytophthora capsici]|nr:hypothetical protein DVH05_016879 [Phytophthora capsici]
MTLSLTSRAGCSQEKGQDHRNAQDEAMADNALRRRATQQKTEEDDPLSKIYEDAQIGDDYKGLDEITTDTAETDGRRSRPTLNIPQARDPLGPPADKTPRNQVLRDQAIPDGDSGDPYHDHE